MMLSAVLLAAGLTAAPVTQELSGEQLYNDYGRGGCVNCHGANGNQPKMPLIPRLGGQSEAYLASQMRDYRNKLRVNGLYIPMENVMATYSDDEIQRIARYLSQQKTF